MELTSKLGKVQWMCDECGAIYDDRIGFFNIDDTLGKKDFCLKCHPMRMSPIQLVEWLAKGNGYVCIQGKYYTTNLEFDLSSCNCRLNGHETNRGYDHQIKYDEHNLVVRYFNANHPLHKKSYWLIPTEKMFMKDCRNGGKIQWHTK